VEQLAPAHRAARRIGGRRMRAIDCIDAASALPPALDARLARRASGRPPAQDGERLRAAIAAARRSLAAPPDLARVRDAFAALAVTLRGDSAS
jgi:poly-gamma-glutamate capsule biosynthesis protein CapA/YwtB (metallophosphatase superfamily)